MILDKHGQPLNIEVVNADSREGLRALAANSVNLIMTPPPYADALKHDYGGVHPDDYVEWFMPFAKEMARVLANDGSLVINIKERVVNGERSTYVHDLVSAMRADGWLWVENYIWHKSNPVPGKWPNRFRDGWEHLHHFTRSRTFKMNQDDVRVPVGDWAQAPSEKNRSGEPEESAMGSGVTVRRNWWQNRDLVYPSNVLYGASEGRNQGHSAAFPVWLPEFFIKLFTDAGDLVVDPFLGSGTTLVAASRLGRNAIGFELLERYYEVAKARVEGERVDLGLLAGLFETPK